MGAVLNVVNDHSPELIILQANIYTPGQGICLQRLKPGCNREFKFDRGLAYGSWYDVQIVARSDDEKAEPQRYLKKGVYLTIGKTIEISELTNEKHRDHTVEWECGACKKTNIGGVATCEHCHTNKAQKYISRCSMIPIVGIPFSVTDAILRCGKAAQSDNTSDIIDAGVVVTVAVVDVITIPFILYSFVKVLGRVAAQTGVELAAINVVNNFIKPLVKELGKDEIIQTVVYVKGYTTLVRRKVQNINNAVNTKE